MLDLARNRLAASTQAAYQRAWDAFCAFAADLPQRAPLAAQLSEYVTHLHRSGRGATAPGFWAAAEAHMAWAGIGLPERSRALVRDAVLGAARVAAVGARDTRVQREPVSYQLLLECERCATAGGATSARDLHDKALLFLCHRLLLRASDCAGLRRCDVRRRGDELIVAVCRQKTAPGERHEYTLSPTDAWPRAYSLLALYLEQTRGAPAQSPLFFLGLEAPRTISATLRSFVRWARPGAALERVSSHSLRIGGATDAARSGMSHIELAALGGWTPTSATLLRYIRHTRGPDAA